MGSRLILNPFFLCLTYYAIQGLNC